MSVVNKNGIRVGQILKQSHSQSEKAKSAHNHKPTFIKEPNISFITLFKQACGEAN